MKDIYVMAEHLVELLEANHLSDWARRIDDVIAGGATGTEILMGLDWNLKVLLEERELDTTVRSVASELANVTDRLLNQQQAESGI